MEKELKEYISDFKEALEILEQHQLSFNGNDAFKIGELLFNQKKRDRDGFIPDDLSTYSAEAFEELEDSLQRAKDAVSYWEEHYYELREDIKDALSKYL